MTKVIEYLENCESDWPRILVVLLWIAALCLPKLLWPPTADGIAARQAIVRQNQCLADEAHK